MKYVRLSLHWYTLTYDADGLQAEASRYQCQLYDLPPLLGDAAGNLVAHLGLDPSVDRLSAKDSLLSHDRRPEDYLDKPAQKVLVNLPATSLLMQKALWRLVQDHVWRHLAFVRPKCVAQDREKAGHWSDHKWVPNVRYAEERKHMASQDLEMHRLSLHFCQTQGLGKMVHGVSKCQGWNSFKQVVKSLATHRNVQSRGAAGVRGVAGAGGPPVDVLTKSVVAYNFIQMLFFTQQFGKGIVQLSKLGATHSGLSEAVHITIGLNYYKITAELDELGENSGQALVVSLISQLLSTELLVFSAPDEAARTSFSPFSSSNADHMTCDMQVVRAMHYCLVLQDVPTEGDLSPPLNHGAIELLAQLCLSAPAENIHVALNKVTEQLIQSHHSAGGMSEVSRHRHNLLRRLVCAGRMRAGEICASKGQVLLQDAALCFYWAERDVQENEDQALNMERYLATMTSLLDLYAAPGRGGSRQTRAKVLDHCSQLVAHMIAALHSQHLDSLHHPPQSLIACQARDLIR